LAQQLVEKLIAGYVDEHLKVNRTPKSRAFFEGETDAARSKLERLEWDLKELKTKTGVVNVGEQRSILIRRLGALEEDCMQTQANIAGAEAGVRHVRQMDGLPANPDTDAQMRLFGKTEAIRIPAMQAKLQSLKSQVAETKAEIKSLTDLESEFQRLERERDIAADNYRQYARNLEQARIDVHLKEEGITNVNVFQEPKVPAKPVRPKKALNLAIGLFLAVAGGLGIGFLAEVADHTVRRPEDLERELGLQPLGSIPRIRIRGSLLYRVNGAHG
jgi:uncharacterized protein involved in exopolysaccharide biosynthesis